MTPPPTLEALHLVRHYAEVAHGAVRQQYDRLKRQPPELYDGYLYALALADLFRAADEAEALTGCSQIGEEADGIAHARDFRNVLEHWPDYACGKGHAAERLKLAPGQNWFSWESREPLRLRIGGSTSLLVLEIEQCESVVRKLYVVLSDALKAAIRKAMGAP